MKKEKNAATEVASESEIGGTVHMSVLQQQRIGPSATEEIKALKGQRAVYTKPSRLERLLRKKAVGSS